jgi:hemoglobin/transferrin/lactoferrin receptor protein
MFRARRLTAGMPARSVGMLLLLLLGSAPCIAPGPGPLAAQQGDPSRPRAVAESGAPADTVVYWLDPLVVTATRTARPIFLTPAPVNLIEGERIRRTHANTATDLFRELPGLDAAGVGIQQARPVIRGQRGQRVLLLQDAMRLNNSRRQQDFGEIPGLVDVSSLERVEVVRGPSSVLYGTDAIGGAINLITRTPSRDGVHGLAGYRFGSATDLHRGSADLFGRFGPVDLQLSASRRDAGEYTAPAGSFGAIRLDAPTTVYGTGVRDRSLAARARYGFAGNHGVFARVDLYDAQDAGFGFVDPRAYDPTQASVDIRYPNQSFRKAAVGYGASGLGTFAADRVDLVAYRQANVRDVAFSLKQALGPPGAHIDVKQYNFSDVVTEGMRLEAKKLALPRLLLTYGLDALQDRTENSDSSITTIVGFGPPRVTLDRLPQVPNATFRTTAAFLQGELTLGRTSLILGSRVQGVRAETRETEGLGETFQSKSNRTVVGSASAIHALSDEVSLVAALGRGFRSPNLIEWFYQGLSTDGRYFQARNPDLEPETSLNLDLGVRLRTGPVRMEAFGYQNRIHNGIRTVPTQERVNNRVVYRNVNIDELIFRGVELDGELALPAGFALAGGYGRQKAKDARDANIPVGDLYSSKLTATLRHDDRADRFWAAYGVRRQGEQRDVELIDNPIGDVLPGFTVQHLRGGATVFRRREHVQRIAVTVGNLTNRLYAETANASFFRPELGRHLIVSWEASF